MNIFLTFAFIFFIGCTIGWIIELFFRKIVNGEWVNPGFLVGPYLPIYGFGLTVLTIIYNCFKNISINPFLIILLMGACMTLIELIGGLIFIKDDGVKLWDYSNQWGNFKGVICPLFSLIWTIIAAFYYYVLATPVYNAINWFSDNLAFSFFVGMFFGVIIIDYIYSTKLYIKIRKYAKENNVNVKLEELRANIKKEIKKTKQKYSFIFSLHQEQTLKDYIEKHLKKPKLIEKLNIFHK